MHPNLYASITALAYALPMTILDNNQLIERFPEWNVEKIEKKPASENVASRLPKKVPWTWASLLPVIY